MALQRITSVEFKLAPIGRIIAANTLGSFVQSGHGATGVPSTTWSAVQNLCQAWRDTENPQFIGNTAVQ